MNLRPIAGLFGAVSIVLSAGSTYAQWEAVGSETGISASGSSFHNLIKDGDDNFYLSFYDLSVSKGSVLKYDDTEWDYLGGEAGVTPGTATYNAIAVDNSGDNLYYSFQGSWPSSELNIMRYNGAEWDTTWYPVSAATVNFQAMTMDASGSPVVVYSSSGNLTVKRYVDNAWIQVGASGFAPSTPYYVDIVAGSNDSIYVSFVASGQARVYKAHVDATTTTSWQTVGTLDAPATSSEQFRSSMAIDSDNNIYIAYVSLSAGGNKLNVQKYDGSSWEIVGEENISEFRAHYVSIAVSSAGTPYVAYSNFEDAPNDKNHVLMFDGSSWIQLDDDGISDGKANYNSLIIDSEGNPVLAYQDGGNGSKAVVKRYTPEMPAITDLSVSTEGSVVAEINTNAGTLQMQASILPATASQEVAWSIVAETGAATIDDDGLVTAVANGVVYAKAISIVDTTMMDSLSITMSNQIVMPTSLLVATAGSASTTVEGIGSTLQLVASILPEEASQDVTWSITAVDGNATVSATGLLTATAFGKVYVKAASVIDAALTDSIEVSIEEEKPTSATLVGSEDVLRVYPNPTSKELNIAFKKSYNACSYTIIDYSGKQILVGDAYNQAKIVIATEQLLPGVYILNIIVDGKGFSQSIVKQ